MSDDLHFKEEILKNIHDFEDDLLKKINKKMIELNKDYKKCHDNLNILSENNKQLIDSLISKNINIEKISSLEQFRNKVEGMLITHEIRINNNIEDINLIKSKYDKALIENLLIPGYIGPKCQFKNIGEYIIHNTNELSKVKSEKDIISNLFKELRIKTDSSMRSILNLNESFVGRCNNYTDNRISELRTLLYEKIEFMNYKEREIKEIIKKVQEEEKNFDKNRQNFGNNLKEDIFSKIDLKLTEIKKNQEEIIYKTISQNNKYLENLVNQIFENKIKIIQENILDIQNKLAYLNKEKDNSFLIKPHINLKNNYKFPLISSLSQKNINIFKYDTIEEKITKKNDFNFNENFKENITISNVDDNKKENYKPNNTYSNSNNLSTMNKNETINKDFIPKSENYTPETNIENRLSKKNITKLILNEQNNNNYEIQKNNIEKSIDSVPFIYKEKDESDILSKRKNSNALIFNYEQKNHNNYKNKLLVSKINIKKAINNNEFMKNFVNLKTLKIENNNKDSDVIDFGSGDEKTFRNIIDDLQTPKILEQKILSNKELQRNSDDKYLVPNTKINHKSELNHSGEDISNLILKNNMFFSPPERKNDFKTLDNCQKKSKIWKSNRSIKIRKDKDKENGCNLVKLELKSDNNLVNGATIIANKKIMNKHITKMKYPNSFASLYNIRIINKDKII